jgi:hypothetical protein
VSDNNEFDEKTKTWRCDARVGRRRCKCRTRSWSGYCSRHWAERIAAETPKASSLQEMFDAINGMATGYEGGLEPLSADLAAKTITLEDMAGSVLVFTLTSYTKAKPFKERLAAAIAEEAAYRRASR